MDSTLYALNGDLSCPEADFDGPAGGYAYFAEDGDVLIGPEPACDDSARAEVAPGTYYLKVVGPASLHLDLNAIPLG